MYTITMYETVDYEELKKMSITQVIDTLNNYQRAFHGSYRGDYGDEYHYENAKYEMAFDKAYDALYLVNELRNAKTDKEKLTIINNFIKKG